MIGNVTYTCCNVDTGGNHERSCLTERCSGHVFHALHHYGKGGKHYCPTGFEECDCGEVRDVRTDTIGGIQVNACVRWGV